MYFPYVVNYYYFCVVVAALGGPYFRNPTCCSLCKPSTDAWKRFQPQVPLDLCSTAPIGMLITINPLSREDLPQRAWTGPTAERGLHSSETRYQLGAWRGKDSCGCFLMFLRMLIMFYKMKLAIHPLIWILYYSPSHSAPNAQRHPERNWMKCLKFFLRHIRHYSSIQGRNHILH